MMSEDFKKGFLKTLWILRAYLSEIIIGGGWAPLIYYHYLIKDKSKQSIRTKDIDLFVNLKVPLLGDRTVDKLLEEAGLHGKFKAFNNPPVVYYEGTIDGENVEIEFLTDQRGAKEEVVIEVQKGLNATALRFVSIILKDSIKVEVDDLLVDGELHPLVIRVPSPEAYIFHKGLIYNRRSGKAKEAKDLYYIFDILANCDDLEEGISGGLKRLGKTYPKWFQKFLYNFENSFSDLNAEGVTMVSSQRPANAFPELNDTQFKQYILGQFQKLLDIKKT
jgi:predicted nucleotidyltransferase